MNALELLARAYDNIAADNRLRLFTDLATRAAVHRPPYWKWTAHLAAAIAMRKNGLA